MVSLARPSKVLYLVGVNHAATGLAAYTNIAPSDPIQREWMTDTKALLPPVLTLASRSVLARDSDHGMVG